MLAREVVQDVGERIVFACDREQSYAIDQRFRGDSGVKGGSSGLYVCAVDVLDSVDGDMPDEGDATGQSEIGLIR